MATNATELQLRADQAIAPVIDYSREQIELIKDVYAKGATDAELRLFIEIARRKGLDIFSNQIYLVERYDSSLGKTVKRPQTSIEGFRLIADRTGNYAPGRKAEFTHDEDGRVITATAFVKKMVKGEWHEVSVEVWFEEYVQTKKDGSVTIFWKRMPHVMLSKCAEAVTLRKAFPADLSGLYTSDEMGNAEGEPAQAPAPARPEPRNVTPKAAPKPAAKTTPKTPIGTLDSLIREIRGYGIADAEIQSHMKNVTGAEKRADLTAEQIASCIEAFEPWANELHAKLTETGDQS
jgi:phage recombination protein Bet